MKRSASHLFVGPGYTTWEQVAGYFDGDGNVGLEVVRHVLRFKLRFVDTWRPQIASIANFLTAQGIRCSSVGKGVKKGVWQPAYRLDIVEVRSVIKAAEAMVEFTVKKRRELQTALRYLKGNLNGNQAIQVFNEAVKSGRRRGKIRDETVPKKRAEGLASAQLENARNARAAHAVHVPAEIQDRIRTDHARLKLGHIRLGKKYGYSTSVIRRVLGAR